MVSALIGIGGQNTHKEGSCCGIIIRVFLFHGIVTKTYAPHVAYCGRLDNQTGCGAGYFAATGIPTKNGQQIIPNKFIKYTAAEDPTRIRINDASRNNVVFNSAIAYYE